MKQPFCIIFIFASLIPPGVLAQTDAFIVGYYPSWNRTLLPAHNIRTDQLTHVNHAFAWPTATGAIQTDANVPDAALIAAVHNGGRKVLIALGGWGHDAGFIPVAQDSTIRKTFISNIINFISIHGYDGIDLDWEFPSNAAQRDSLTSLVRDLRSAMDNVDSSYLLTMAVPISNWSGRWIDFPSILPSINWFNAMAYDIHGSWTNHAGHNAPLYAPTTDYDGSAHQGIQYLNITRGVPKKKIMLGVPFYGKQFTASALYGTQTGVSDVTYTAVETKRQSGWPYVWDDVSKVPYLSNSSNTAIVTFDDTISMKEKSRYVKNNGLAGIMIWALGQDIVSGKQVLLETVASEMFSVSHAGVNHRTPPVGYVLENNYPNPFNPVTIITYEIPKQSFVSLTVYDVLGREAVRVVNSEMAKGRYSVSWDGSDCASGVYFYRLLAGEFIETKRMVLAR